MAETGVPMSSTVERRGVIRTVVLVLVTVGIAAIVIAATEDTEVNRSVYAAGRASGA